MGLTVSLPWGPILRKTGCRAQGPLALRWYSRVLEYIAFGRVFKLEI